MFLPRKGHIRTAVMGATILLCVGNRQIKGQDLKRYDCQQFAFSYPSSWGSQEVAPCDITIGDPDESNPLKNLRFGILPRGLSDTEAKQGLNADLSDFAARNGFRLSYKESGFDAGRVEVWASLSSDREKLDVIAGVTLSNGFLYEIFLEPSEKKKALANATPIIASVHLKSENTQVFPEDKSANSGESLPQAGNDSGWRTYQSPDATFRYPMSAKLQVNSEKHLVMAVDSTARSFGIEFFPGVHVSPDILNQCASVDDILQFVYEKEISNRFSTSHNQYPYTSVTHDDFKPGWMGGRSTWATITRVEKWQKPVTLEVWLNAVPRADGVYVVMYGHPSEAMNISEPIRQTFINSIVFRSGPLGAKDYCNYLGR